MASWKAKKEFNRMDRIIRIKLKALLHECFIFSSHPDHPDHPVNSCFDK
jgi:hypothetical protein